MSLFTFQERSDYHKYKTVYHIANFNITNINTAHAILMCPNRRNRVYIIL